MKADCLSLIIGRMTLKAVIAKGQCTQQFAIAIFRFVNQNAEKQKITSASTLRLAPLLLNSSKRSNIIQASDDVIK